MFTCVETVIQSHFASAKPAVIIGVMSGTSLDGLDLCAVQLHLVGNQWTYKVLAAKTITYPQQWLDTLQEAYKAKSTFVKTGHALQQTHEQYGAYIGKCVRGFSESENIQADLIASHGHTIFHQPDAGITLQIGCGQAIANHTGVPTVSDFRSLDVSLGGQGAPLVPIADRLLFAEYAQCVNLGGIANLSHESQQGRVAQDATVCNLVLNALAQQLNLPYDDAGKIAASGHVDDALLRQFIELPFHTIAGPKSLGREWLEQTVWPLLRAAQLSPQNALATMTYGIAHVLAGQLAHGPAGRILITGGGAYNEHLVATCQDLLSTQRSQNTGGESRLILPEPQLIEFKEALAFALLGALRVRGEANCLASVTGANRDSSGGIYTEPEA